MKKLFLLYVGMTFLVMVGLCSFVHANTFTATGQATNVTLFNPNEVVTWTASTDSAISSIVIESSPSPLVGGWVTHKTVATASQSGTIQNGGSRQYYRVRCAKFVEGATMTGTIYQPFIVSSKDVKVLRQRVLTADVNAGIILLPATPNVKYRMISCRAIAYGASAGAVTTVDILGTQTSSVKLVAFAQGSLIRSTVLTAGGTGAAVLPDGASFAACDVNTAITIGITGSSMTTSTGIDIIIEYVIDAA